MSWNTDGQTQAQIDHSENGTRPSGGDYRRIGDREPHCPLCKGVFIRKSVDVAQCCKCKEEFTSVELKARKINIGEIG
ncbi:MAG: hypothetical protein WCQ16_07890 [Verrucomicrobiae bacterium]